MKVLFWMDTGFDIHTTSEHLLREVINQLVDAGNKVHIIQTSQNGSLPSLSKRWMDSGVTTDVITSVPVKKKNFAVRYINAIRYFLRCKNAIKNHKESDAIFIQSTMVAGVAVRIARRIIRNVRITINIQDIFPYNAAYSKTIKRKGILFRFLAGVQRYGYKRADHIITISEDMKDLLIEDGVPAEKIEVIYNWSYQDEPYQNVNLSSVSHIFCKDYFNVVYAGNIGVMQNVDILVETARLMKEDNSVWFHIIGNGVYKDKLESRAKEYGITNISFWPMQPAELAPVIYSAADVNVIPLEENVYRTALPSKTATCMACGKPIIFAIGAESKFGQRIKEYKGCYLIGSNSSEDMMKAINEIRNNDDSTCQISTFFRQNMSASNNSKKYAEIITSGEIHTN